MKVKLGPLPSSGTSQAVPRGDAYPHEVAASVAATMNGVESPESPPTGVAVESGATDHAIMCYAKQGR